MGNLIRVWKTVPLPTGAKIGRSGTVTWTVKGKKRTGKLSGTDKVSHQVDTWSAEYTDETGKVRRVSTKTKNRSAAEQILARYEAEVARIKSGVVTREELTKAQTPQITHADVIKYAVSTLQKYREKDNGVVFYSKNPLMGKDKAGNIFLKRKGKETLYLLR